MKKITHKADPIERRLKEYPSAEDILDAILSDPEFVAKLGPKGKEIAKRREDIKKKYPKKN